MIKVVSGLVGLLLIFSAAFVNAQYAGGFATPAGIVVLALATGVAVGAAALGTAGTHGRVWLALAIAVGLVAGEGYALISTGERVIAARELAQAKTRKEQAAYDAATRRFELAKARLRDLEATAPESARVVAAKGAVDSANQAIREQAALAGCRLHCRELLQAAADNARREYDAATAAAADDLKQRMATAHQEHENAKSALETTPAPQSASPLADRLGIAPWALDLISAGLLALGLNGLGAALVAFGIHHTSINEARATTRSELMQQPEKAETIETLQAHMPEPQSNVVALINHNPLPEGRVAAFLLDVIERQPRGQVEVATVFDKYRQWCATNHYAPLSLEKFGDDLRVAVEISGIQTRARRGRVYLCGVSLGEADAAAAG